MNLHIVKAGRRLFAVPFAGFGLLHLTLPHMFAGMVPPFVPGGIFWVYLIGTAFVVAAAALITGKMARQAAYGIAGVLVLFILTIWVPRLWASPESPGPALAGLFKDFGLMAGALLVAGTIETS